LTHERLLAKEAREQQRLESAYVRMLAMTEQAGQWAQKLCPLMDTNPPQPVPAELPSLEEQAHTVALVQAFGCRPHCQHSRVYAPHRGPRLTN
jgi:hypothetical protein